MAQLSFSYPIPLNTNAGDDSYDDFIPKVASGGDGKWVAVWHSQQNIDGIGNDYDILVATSSDNGETWSAPRALNTNATEDSGSDQYPDIAVNNAGVWVVVWSSSENLNGIGSDYDILVAKSTNNGQTWTAPASLHAHFTGDSYPDTNPDIATDGGNNWIVVWESEEPGVNSRCGTDLGNDYDILRSYSSDNAATWSAPDVVPGYACTDEWSHDDRYPSVAMTSSGMTVVVWESNVPWSNNSIGDDNDILYMYSYSAGHYWDGGQWVNSTAVTDSGSDEKPQIATDGNANWVVVWHSTENLNGIGTDWDILVARSSTGTAWYPTASLKTSATADGSSLDQWPHIATDREGHWVAAWTSTHDLGGIQTDYDILMSASTNNGANWAVPEPLNEDFAAAGTGIDFRPQVAADGAGNWLGVWQSKENIDGIGSDYDILVASVIPPMVYWVPRVDANPNDKDIPTVRWEVWFTEPVWSVNASDFSLTTTGITGASITGVDTTFYNRYTVSANTGTGEGTITLNIIDDDSIVDEDGNSLGGWGTGNGNATGAMYTMETKPVVSHITLLDGSPTNAGSVRFQAVFSENVTGVGATDFSTVTSGGVSGTAVTDVAKVDGRTYRVTASTGTGDGFIYLRVVDDDSIRDIIPGFTTGIPLGGWNTGNGTFTSSAYYSIDKSPPVAVPGSVLPDGGPFTNENTHMTFKWPVGFSDDQSDIAYFQVEFGPQGSPGTYHPWASVGKVYDITFSAENLLGPGAVFPEGTYVCSVRAVNNVGLVSGAVSATKTVDTTALKVGEGIPFPDGRAWGDIDWTNTTFSPTTHVVLIKHAEKFLVGDYGSEITVNWVFVPEAGGGGLTRQYNTSSETAAGHSPVVIYHTHTGDDPPLSTRAPAVNLFAFNHIKIHYNEAVPDVSHLWYDGNHNLYARGPMIKEPPNPTLVILEFNDVSNPDLEDFIGFEILQVKRCEPDVQEGVVDIGSRLLPTEMPAVKAIPLVTAGLDVGGVPYVYQHLIPGSPQEGDLWAVHKNTNPANMEVIWKEMRYYEFGAQQLEAVWPLEFRRYRTPNWPTDSGKYQKYVRGDTAEDLGPEVIIPLSLNASIPYKEFDAGLYADLSPNADGQAFNADGPGWALLKYETGEPSGYEWVGFEVVRCVNRLDPLVIAYDPQVPPQPVLTPWDIGTEITDAYHAGPRPGYIHASEGNRYAPGIYDTDPDSTGQIFAVNTGILEVWWSNLSRTEDPEGSQWPAWPVDQVQWPSKVMRYNAVWPGNSEKIIIASTLGSGDIDPAVCGAYGTDWTIYMKDDIMASGFNPNDEHAFVMNDTIYALRCDLGTPETSEPYVLMKYHEQSPGNRYRFRVFQVVAEGEGYFFHQWDSFGVPEDPYKIWAGSMIEAPYPVNKLLGFRTEGVGSDPGLKWWKDVNGNVYARAAGDDGVSPADLTVRFHYPVQDDFYFPETLSYPYDHDVLDVVPWLDRLGNPSGEPSGVPVDVTYTAYWPEEVDGTIRIGQTIVNGEEGFDAIDGNCTAAIIYDQSVAQSGDPAKQSVMLINPTKVRSVPLAGLPPEITTLEVNADGEILKTFPDLSLALQRRVGYDEAEAQLLFWGVIVEPNSGFQYPILNVMSAAERDELCGLDDGNPTCGSSSWDTAVKNLYLETSEPVSDVVSGWTSNDWPTLALTAGFAQGTGYVTIALQNSEDCQNHPDVGGVSLMVIKVAPDLFTGQITSLYADCAFKETVTMRHSGDFGGHPENYHFQWVYMPDPGYEPETPVGDTPGGWFNAADDTGAIAFTIQGPGLLTLSDNYFAVRYKYTGSGLPWSDTWSDWSEAALAEGWIKRVVGNIDGYTQGQAEGGVQGGKILGPVEEKFFDYGDEIDTVISMITKAGARWTGDIPLSCSDLNQFGLIEIYETVLNRGAELSIDAGYVDDAANSALLLVGSRIADLYMLLGNEAYADAQDPTIAFGTEDGEYGAEASSIHCFMNVEGGAGTLMEEELSLLRGRDDSQAGGVQLYPLYNRLVWNYTNGLTGGEVAYSLNYNTYDKTDDGFINLSDAKAIFPQGHGDAWGHYLTALKTYYRLLTHPNYEWNARPETLLVGGASFSVDYYDERKFAAAAAAKARTGAEIVNLTYRSEYVEDPAGQWQGYKDADPERAWGLSEWASRAGEGAYIDWVVGNAILPAVSPKTGVEKIDRTTVLELRDVASRFEEIQAQVDMADVGLNPLGLATNVIPFDISPTEIDQGKTHFEQIYERAVAAMNNAIAVFDHANNSTQLLRRQADSQIQFEQTVEDREIDFKNRLIEIYGYPYVGDPEASDLNGPDLKHYMYIDPSALVGWERPPIKTVTFDMTGFEVLSDGSIESTREPVTLHYSMDADRYGLFKPHDSWGERQAPGEIQLALSEVLQARVRFERALKDYDNRVNSIEDQLELLHAQYDLNAEEIEVLNAQLQRQESANQRISECREAQTGFRCDARHVTLVQNAMAEALPKENGMANDLTSFSRSALLLMGSSQAESYTEDADRESLAELNHQQALQAEQARTNIVLTTSRGEFAIQQQVKQLEQMFREENASRFDLYSQQEAMHQACGRYKSALARGLRLLEDIARFKRQTAAEVQSRRYKDMAFRIFRNDALQKYRAQFDMAARYVYLAAKAYDYETTFLSSDWRAGENFLTNIVRARLIGKILEANGQPDTGVGLADPMKRMSLNFSTLKGQLGFNIPQRETNRLSLRSELFRILPGYEGNARWRETLWHHVVPNLLDLPEFQRYCIPFYPTQDQEPGIVIPFSTNINEGLNVFGWPTIGGSTSYDSTHFTTKVRSVGVWFSNYNNLMIGGLSNTPRVYLVPAGADIQRSPTGYLGVIREFAVLDQVLPLPYPVGSGELSDPTWIPCLAPPMNTFADVRRFARFRAYHDSGAFSESEVIRDSRLIGRSVWNTRWLLVIPAGSFYYDRQEGLKRFIDGMLIGDERDGNGVSDISIIFETYAYAPY